MAGKWGDGSDFSSGGAGTGGVADEKEVGGRPSVQGPSEAERKRAQRTTAMTRFTSYGASSLAGFDVLGLGVTPGSMNEEGGILGNPNLIYENGNLMVRTDMIDAFTGIFKGQNEAAKAKAASFLAQDTVLTGASNSKKGTVLGGVI